VTENVFEGEADEPLTMTQVEYAEHRRSNGHSCTPQYISKLKTANDPRLHLDAKGRVLVALTDEALAAEGDPAQVRTQPPAAGQVRDEDQVAYKQAATKAKRLEADTAEIKFRKLAGELVDRAEVTGAVFTVFRDMRDKMLASPTRMAGKLITLKTEREVVAYMQGEFNSLLSDFARTLTEQFEDDAGAPDAGLSHKDSSPSDSEGTQASASDEAE